MNRGVLYAAGAYACWGLLPVFWKLLQHVDALEIVAHRIVWSLAFALVLLTLGRRWSRIGVTWRDRRVLATFLATGMLLTANWFVYVWAVNADHIVETSLGYFINPLINVLLGALVLKERLRIGQGVAMSVALAGVLSDVSVWIVSLDCPHSCGHVCALWFVAQNGAARLARWVHARNGASDADNDHIPGLS